MFNFFVPGINAHCIRNIKNTSTLTDRRRHAYQRYTNIHVSAQRAALGDSSFVLRPSSSFQFYNTYLRRPFVRP